MGTNMLFERLNKEFSSEEEENITEEENRQPALVMEEGPFSTEIQPVDPAFDLSGATPDIYQLNLSVVVTRQ